MLWTLETAHHLCQHRAKVCDTRSGKRIVASPYTFTGRASARIFPQDTASSGRAPESLPSNSCVAAYPISIQLPALASLL